MWSIVEAAGWPIWTIILASVVSLAIIFERLISLRRSVVAPEGLLSQTLQEYRSGGASAQRLERLERHSPLGRLFAAGVRNVDGSREVMKEAIEDEGRIVAHQLERFLTTLGTIAAMSPLMGLLGTVIGMIDIFGSQNASGTNPQQLAHGISVALYNTAFGLIVAIPSMIFYRHFRAQVDALLVEMEAQAVKLVEVLHGDRRNNRQ
ncbi:MotA/TolQ/ExbB proton channel family protein [Crenobacter cavernae]|uniref:MotA/TolQ/ExbB proton channel family protein n=1 Tax=Crenobacter cavernae TaxID=2290923 RepID=A0A345Y2V2_9NEIS|nr:MotA/TolQ/ExbB proton channel family protein [Crenobacter cavernae]AXK38254.1 MotA/TolQ/ExbB proton channel family protein [Crenobacter cavernae]